MKVIVNCSLNPHRLKAVSAAKAASTDLNTDKNKHFIFVINSFDQCPNKAILNQFASML